ncbi:putative Xre family DNA binding protein [Gordonia araii NBRC 100433]|uniref:Putative Xre family DNA binding protein n=1 Tax=Gordonia araii NBRC 100433 TaxID=1073574 RepID=G7GYY6_9ACTN|nr:helix-turn-helix transcriptional regulator [Gordonia araii]NNG97021.1 helix-turn-helix transcriptional regulator [Gordonia araii NBRC 100433]GAB08811.1 putative Xre family DNA binding protein [Gordonia araii NBRC 100433]
MTATTRNDEPEALWREVLGEVLREERAGQRRILTNVAAEAGVSPQYLSEIERGRKEPSSEILAAVAGALGLSLLEVTAAVASRLAASSQVPVVSTLSTITSAPVSPGQSPTSGRASLHLVA